MSKRPQINKTGSYVTTPQQADMICLLGPGMMTPGGVLFSRDETRALNKLYAFHPEEPRQRPPEPVRELGPDGRPVDNSYKAADAHKAAVAAWKAWEDPSPLMQAAADHNMVRHATHDGLRLIAWMAKYMAAGDDPLKTFVQLAVDAGWDVSPEDIAWLEDLG